MTDPLNETAFEEHITRMLANSALYNERKSADFDIETLCDKEMLERFLRAQELTWKKLTQFFPGRETDTSSRSTITLSIVEIAFCACCKRVLPSRV